MTLVVKTQVSSARLPCHIVSEVLLIVTVYVLGFAYALTGSPTTSHHVKKTDVWKQLLQKSGTCNVAALGLF